MKYIKYILFAGLVGTMSSCVSDLLDRQPTTEVSSDLFWKSTDDALSSTYGVYNAIRDLYATDYYYDGQGEFQNTRGKSIGSITGWSPAAWVTSGFSSMWNNAYKTINRANFTIQNIERMIEIEGNATTRTSLERINAENYFLRALAYFRLRTGVMCLTIAMYSQEMLKLVLWNVFLLQPSRMIFCETCNMLTKNCLQA